MIFAIDENSTIYVCAASSIEEFENFRQNIPDAPEGLEAKLPEILEALTDPRFSKFEIAPVYIEYSNDEQAKALISAWDLSMLPSRDHAYNYQEAMREEARLSGMLSHSPNDRRTLGEIYKLDENDPWSNLTDEQKEKNRARNEEMQKVRDAGGLTQGSFGGKSTKSLILHDAKVTVDQQNKEITGVDVKAIKRNLTPYRIEITADNAATIFTEIADEMKIPENRIEKESDTVQIIQLHLHQVEHLAKSLEDRGVDFDLQKVAGEDDGQDAIVIDDESVKIFYSVQIDGHKISDITAILTKAGFDLALSSAMKDEENGCWLAFPRESMAEDAQSRLEDAGITSVIVAINNKGQAIVEAGSGDFKIVDTHVDEVQEPRPWNDRADEYEAMSDDEKAELIKTIKGGEFIFSAQRHPTLKNIVRITPAVYFDKYGVIWQGEVPVDHIITGNILKRLDDYTFSANMEHNLLVANLCHWGFEDSLMLQMHLNDMKENMDA